MSGQDSAASRFALPWLFDKSRWNVMTLHAARRLAPILCMGILLSFASTAAVADERCAQLVALNKQYAGVALTSEQKDIKLQLVAWYKANCGQSIRSVRRSIGASESAYASQY